MNKPRLSLLIKFAEKNRPICRPGCPNATSVVEFVRSGNLREYTLLAEEWQARCMASRERLDSPERLALDDKRERFRHLRRTELFEYYTRFRLEYLRRPGDESVILDATGITERHKLSTWFGDLRETLINDLFEDDSALIKRTHILKEEELEAWAGEIQGLGEMYIKGRRRHVFSLAVAEDVAGFIRSDKLAKQWGDHAKQHYSTLDYPDDGTGFRQEFMNRYAIRIEDDPLALVKYFNFSVNGNYIFVLDQQLHCGFCCDYSVCRDYFREIYNRLPKVLTFQSGRSSADNNPVHTREILSAIIFERRRKREQANKLIYDSEKIVNDARSSLRPEFISDLFANN
jgi:hypothetical protein